MVGLLLKAGKARILTWTLILLGLTSLADWISGKNVSLAALYILPMMLGAVVMPTAGTAALAIACSLLRGIFENPGSPVEASLRFIFALFAYLVSGLFVHAVLRNHELVIQHLHKMQAEQALRREVEEQLRELVGSSPAAILTMDGTGTVLAANAAANGLFMMIEGQSLEERKIQSYLPVLAEVLSFESGQEGLRTTAQCQGFRENGEIFLAHIWFSSYRVPEGTRLAAIVVDESEEMREREEQGLRQLFRGNRIATAAVAHEVRNFCGAISILFGNLAQRHNLERDEDLQGLRNLIAGLEGLAALDLRAKSQEILERVSIREVLNNLRIVIEPDWQEIEGTVRWSVPPDIPPVLADPRGLLQAFMNLVQNSHRAVQERETRELSISVSREDEKVFVRFKDTGPGVKTPESLFHPFQDGAAGSGLGLYVSRIAVRSYGGELRFEPQHRGACFSIELHVA